MSTKPTSIASLLVATLVSSLGFTALAASPAAAGRNYVWAMDGNSGPVSRVSGGGVRALVETTVVDGAVFKDVVGLAREDVVLDLDLAALPGSLADWINESWERRYARRSGSWAELDDFGNVVQAREVIDAHITEVRFPKLDASSVEPAPVELRISSDLVEDAPAPSPSAAPTASRQKKWLVSSFDFQIDGFDDTNVIQIDEFVVRPSGVGDDAGIGISNLVIRFAAEDAGPWTSWFERFVIDGKCADSDELTGSITFLAPDQKTELGRLELERVGIVSLSMDSLASDAAGIPVTRAEIWIEDADLHFDSAKTDE